MKILIDMSYLGLNGGSLYTGVGNYAKAFLSYLLKMEKQNDFVVMIHPNYESLFKKEFPQFKYAVLKKQWMSLKEKLRFPLNFEFSNYVRHHAYDSIFCPQASYVSKNSFHGLPPKITTIHDLSAAHHATGLKKKWIQFIDKSVVESSDKIACISNVSKEDVSKHYPQSEKKISVIYNSMTAKESSLNRSIKDPYILYVAQFIPSKNMPTLLKALCRIKEIPQKLVIVGKKTTYFHQEIEPLLQEYDLTNKINIIENCSDMELQALYRFADLYVHPSLWEGFGYPPIEAAMQGTPVLSSRAGSLPETTMEMLHYYTSPLDSGELSNRINELLLTDRETMNLEAIAQKFKERYTVESPRRLLDLILETAKQKRNA
jgi:glycosyltransferase involved in cell wall biosynthesis